MCLLIIFSERGFEEKIQEMITYLFIFVEVAALFEVGFN